jgi:hypothetical protein
MGARRSKSPYIGAGDTDRRSKRAWRNEVLHGLWIEQNEGAKFWTSIVNELKSRGVQDILLAAVDGLTGFPEAIAAVFPKTEVQLCMIHMVCNSLRFVPYKDRKAVITGLKNIAKKWTMPIRDWGAALNQFAIIYGEDALFNLGAYGGAMRFHVSLIYNLWLYALAGMGRSNCPVKGR